jgi:hypothetical protein
VYVIFAGPEQHGNSRSDSGGRSRYIANDGQKVTDDVLHAASFLTHGEALEFAKEKDITLNDVTRYIGQVKCPYRET